MTEKYEWKVPESWIRAAVNLYLGTITTPPGDHRCVSVQKTTDYQENLFCVTIERNVVEPGVVPA